MGFFQNAIYIGIFLGVLVAVHEAGHFFAAKWANVKVLKFSIGFGPKLFSFRRGETEYQLAIVPLGGFVAMAGQQPGEDVDETDDPKRTFLGAPWWKRVIILLAGPGANLLFAVVALFFVFLGDSQGLAARVGAVEPGSPAAVAGFKAGDVVVSIDGTPIATFEELSKIASVSADRELTFVVEREGQHETLKVTPATVETFEIIDVKKKGRIGISLHEQAAVIGVPVGSAAAQAGLKTFDRIISIDGRGIRSARELTEVLSAASGTVKLQVVRFKSIVDGVAAPALVSAEVALADGEGLARIGAEGGDAYVWQVRPGTVAAAFGIKVGDRFTSVLGLPVHSVGAVEERMALARKKAIEIEWVSDGVAHRQTVGPLVVEGNAKYCMTAPDFGVRFGAPGLAMKPVTGLLVDQHLGPGDAFVAASRELRRGVTMIAEILGKLTTGDVPLESMGGPLQIAQVATQSAEAGLNNFLGSMSMVSVNLALVNLLPIPILDGFGILSALWEAIRRRPVPMRAREVATYFGLAALGLLMVVAFRNDIARLLFC